MTVRGDGPELAQQLAELRVGGIAVGDQRGLVNYDAGELPAIMGRSTRWLSAKLGPEYEREVVHRDDLVVLRPGR